LSQPLIKSEAILGRSDLCDLWELPFIGNNFNSPSLSTFFITFSTVYMVLPMILSGNFNYPILILLLFLLVGDSISKYTNKCTNFLGVVLGIVIGSISSSALTLLLYYSLPEAVFFGPMDSNKVSCSKPVKQKVKCVLKSKNGVVIKEL